MVHFIPFLLAEVILHPYRIFLLLTVVVPASLLATTVLDFEGFPDSTILTNQYTGVTFSNTIILTAGVSLNEFEFPPHSGTNVASDNGGPISIVFSGPILSFGGYFTYSTQLTLAGFNALNNQVAGAASAFSNNEALSGDIGSSPNEFLQVSFAAGISKVTITGDPAGGSFTLDDATFTSAVPEPGSMFLILGGVTGLLGLRRTLL